MRAFRKAKTQCGATGDTTNFRQNINAILCRVLQLIAVISNFFDNFAAESDTNGVLDLVF